MTKKKDDKYWETDDERAERAEATEAVVSSFTVEVPEGFDEAIYRQGFGAAQADAAAPVTDPPAPPTENAFTAGTPQADSWQAGYDAGGGTAPLP